MNPAGPGGPTAPALLCPANVTVSGVTGHTRAVTYAVPAATGGLAPVSTSCAPASGAPFPLGTTTVGCTATDARGQQGSCSFAVTLTPLRLVAMKLVAFGDSLTEGENGSPPTGPCPPGLHCVDSDHSYPTVLQSLLTAEFPTQNLTVINEGRGGERIADATNGGIARLPGVLSAHRPDVLLLLGGYNDLLGDGLAGVGPVVDALRTCVRVGRQAGVQYAFVSTITPSRPGRRAILTDAILQTNAGIKSVVAAEGAHLVDSYAGFLGHEQEYISDDGLHLKPAGYQSIAESFHAAIRAQIPTMIQQRLSIVLDGRD